MLTHTQAGDCLKGNLSSVVVPPVLVIQGLFKGMNDPCAPGEITGGIFANTHDPPCRRLIVKHGVEFDDAVYLCERNTQGIANGNLHFPWKPAV
jgi:hypothetical protein